ncbi:hypothetical protein [Bacillus licheniformis]|nr:hypothetical protein [Bacillus licheniformis]
MLIVMVFVISFVDKLIEKVANRSHWNFAQSERTTEQHRVYFLPVIPH